ncbi:MAG: glycosyltransferase family 4 protein [Deltaproteobacteria bacterium]|nr:glycosyltransferase family 4 protein [Deltaproteobacteria bacterium]
MVQKIIGLIHTRFSPIGGVENYINKLVPDLLNRNWQIHYFAGKIEQPILPGMILHNIPIIRGTSISRMLSFAYGARKTARRVNLPLVMGFGRTIYQDIYRDGSGCFLDYQKYANKRFNFLYRTSYLHLERKRFNDPRLQKVIAVSKMVKEQIVQRYNLPPEKIEVVYSGVNHEHLNPSFKEEKSRFKKQLGLPQNTLTLLFIGNGFARKGLQYLIEAFGSLPSQLPIILLVVGKDKHEERYQHLAQTLGCAHCVHFLGYRKDVGRLYATADLFVLPSLFDPIANVVLESLYSGTPVITGSQVGASELIDHGNNGYVIPDYRPETLAEAILKFYYSEKKERMAEKAYQAAAAYRWDYHVDTIERIFLEVLDQKKKRHRNTTF